MSLRNTATSLAFEVSYDAEVPTPGQLAYALVTRVADLLGEDQSELFDAAWDPWDTVENDSDLAWQNGIDVTPDLSAWEMRTLVRTIRQITSRKKAA